MSTWELCLISFLLGAGIVAGINLILLSPPKRN